jgi:hypothetical protein
MFPPMPIWTQTAQSNQLPFHLLQTLANLPSQAIVIVSNDFLCHKAKYCSKI